MQNWRAVKISDLFIVAGEGIKIYGFDLLLKTGFFLFGEMIGKGSIIGYQIPGTDHAVGGGH